MEQFNFDNALSHKVPRISIITMGCAKNEADSYAMSSQLLAAGYLLEENPERADAIIINTCSFIQAATEESLETIFDVASLPRVISQEVPLVVVGCMPSRYGEELEKELYEAAAFVTCRQESNIVSFINSVLVNRFSNKKENCVNSVNTYQPSDVQGEDEYAIDLRKPSVSTFAYVKISEGCSRCCSYCTIPSIRGNYRSLPFEEIERCVSEHVQAGAREIVLIAQDTGCWGSDFKKPLSLFWLLEKLADEFPQSWFRVMYLQPDGITDELLEVMKEHNNVCSYLDIPLQHVNESLLHKMNRRGNYKRFKKLISRIRSVLPGITLRTTFMVGFPGETEDQFEELCEFVSEGFFDYVGVFAYSREEGTSAYEFPDQLEEYEKADRAQRLRDIADITSSALISERIGNIYDVIVEGFEEDGQLYGRAMCQAPEVDGVTYVPIGNIGDIVSVRIIDTLLYEMEGE